jgi:hypothetical protein
MKPQTLLFLFLTTLQVFFYFDFYSKKEPELMSYYDNNMSVVKSYCEKSQYRNPLLITVKFEDTDEHELAHCQRKLNSFRIIVNKDYWNSFDENKRTQLMMHEMVHCLFNLDHVDDDTHFMSPYMGDIPQETYEQQVKELLLIMCSK